MLTFWDTVRGQDTAEAIIRIASAMKRRQYVKTATSLAEMKSIIISEVEAGHRLVTWMDGCDGEYLAIFEKKQ